MANSSSVSFKALRWIAVAVTVVLFGASNPSQAADLPGQGTTIRLAHTTDLESLFQTYVVALGLERLGYEIEMLPIAANAILYTSISQGDADLAPTNWWPMHKSFFTPEIEKNVTNVGVIYSNALQGYLIDKRSADELKITNVEQLKDPEIAKLFDTDGDGKGNLAGCPVGWGCEKMIDHHLKAYGLEPTVEHDHGDPDILHADVVARFKAGERVLYYNYTPSWLDSTLIPGTDVVWLAVPFTSYPADMGSELPTDEVDGKNLGFMKIDVVITANNNFLEHNPSARRFLQIVNVPIEDVSAEHLLLRKGEKSERDVRRHAEDWIKRNEPKFDAWIEEAIAAAKT